MQIQVHPAARVENLHLDRGIHLTKYGGGDDMKEAKSLLHFTAENVPVNPTAFEMKIISKVREALSERNPEKHIYAKQFPEKRITENLPQWDTVDWSKCEVDLSIHVSSNIRGNDPIDSANAFFQGWLFDKAAEANVNAISFPPISVLQRDDGCILPAAYAESDIAAISFNGNFRFADQHIHHTSGGITLEDLISAGSSEEDARRYLEFEALTSNDYCLGSDMARFTIDSSHESGSAIFAVCDLQDIEIPRILISFVIVVINPGLEKQVTEINKGLLEKHASSGISLFDVAEEMSVALPSIFPGRGSDQIDVSEISACACQASLCSESYIESGTTPKVEGVLDCYQTFLGLFF
jgi:hypothetical protein